ncbi:SMP-30/gluconolactonase/LRE family protein [Plantibacter sp. YIM 135347]|uniref:SMP-30/gluconolactonase/LRE family protein n=1 Tax=Plantibacter sp. YIM 135347 TaxID=3423919 RepID=UPI003D325E0F
MDQRSRTPSVFRDTRSILVESIWWDDAAEWLVWVDISAGTLHRSPLDGARDGGDDLVVELPPPLTAVQPRAGGGFVASLGDRVVLLDADGAIERTLVEIEHAHAGLRLNEGKVDPFGRFIVGSMNLTTGEPDAALYSVEPDGSSRTLLGGFGVANGFEWSPDGSTMYVTDTAASTVYRAEYGPDGDLGALEPFLVGHASDGLALDVDGCFWNGVYGEGVVLRWTPGGEVAEEIAVDAPNVTSVAFGGPGFGTLFVGSAREQLTEEQLVRSPLSGGVFSLDVGVSGRAPHRFGRV